VRRVSEQARQADLVESIDVALHSLCQPLTVLQCRLALGEMIDEPNAMREAIHEALQECVRLNQRVGTLRTMLQVAKAEKEDERVK
jgi:signal transduction histidine kinase